ncbi:TPM domain-containing protein [Uliginosibacterium paludis]|uniref:TPM domain-containing protein n=1 Tax=Uliginosibacterium paludis TaxID=1615952 RepID=A0ABV2CQV4_9RHOO
MLSVCRSVLCCVLLMFCLPAFTATSVESLADPRANGGSRVANPDSLLSPATVAQIDAELAEIERATGVQVAVVALGSVAGDDVFGFAQSVFERWGIGRKGHDDGALILLALAQRTVRIHTGYGLEGVLPDVVCQRITRELMLPALREGRYDDGMLAGVQALRRLLLSGVEAGQSVAAGARPALRVVELMPRTEPEAWLTLRWFLAAGLVIAGIIWQLRYRPGEPAGGPGLMRLQDLPKPLHAAVFTGLPLLMIVALDRLHPPGLPWLALSGVYLFYLGAALLRARALRQRLDAMFERSEHANIARVLNDERGFWGLMAAIFPLPLGQNRFAPEVLARGYRFAPRACPHCAQPGMKRLSEAEEDAFLSRIEQIEESLGAVEYDVWLCGTCGGHSGVAFAQPDAFHSRCPDCQGMTRELVNDEVRYAATATSGGSGVRHYRCRACNKRTRETYSLARLASDSTSSSFSSSSSSSSFSSDSASSSSSSDSGWGGGSSGGGGSSSSW